MLRAGAAVRQRWRNWCNLWGGKGAQGASAIAHQAAFPLRQACPTQAVSLRKGGAAPFLAGHQTSPLAVERLASVRAPVATACRTPSTRQLQGSNQLNCSSPATSVENLASAHALFTYRNSNHSLISIPAPGKTITGAQPAHPQPPLRTWPARVRTPCPQKGRRRRGRRIRRLQRHRSTRFTGVSGLVAEQARSDVNSCAARLQSTRCLLDGASVNSVGHILPQAAAHAKHSALRHNDTGCLQEAAHLLTRPESCRTPPAAAAWRGRCRRTALAAPGSASLVAQSVQVGGAAAQ